MFAANFLGFTDFGPDDSYILNKDLENYNITHKQCNNIFKNLCKRLIKAPGQKTFIIMFWAGHGMSLDASQVFVLNEFNKKIQFYKTFAAEKKIRVIANSMKNSYQLSIFACCRELYKITKHCSCVHAESLEEAQKLIDKRDQAKKLEKAEA